MHAIVSKVASVIDQDLDRRQSKFPIETISRSQVTSLAATQAILKGVFKNCAVFSECNISPHVGESGFWNPGNICLLNPEFGNFYLWNAESWASESDIQLKESRIPLRILGTRNPSSTDKESRIRCVESRIQDSWIRLHGQNSFSLCFITSLTCLM